MRRASLWALACGAVWAVWWSGTGRAAPVVTSGVVNLVAAENGGRIVAVSSEARDRNGQVIPQWAARNLIDGKYVVGTFVPPDSYGWSSASAPSPEHPEWIVFAFRNDETRLINRIVIDPTTDDSPLIGRWVRDVEVQVSSTTPNGPYKSVGRFIVVNKPIKQTFEFPPVEARYVRLVITGNHGSDKCVEMGEVEIYEAIVSSDVLDQLIIRLENLLMDLKRYRDGMLYQQAQQAIEAVTRKPAPPGAVAAGAAEKAEGGGAEQPQGSGGGAGQAPQPQPPQPQPQGQ
jgi:hypothetical protein